MPLYYVVQTPNDEIRIPPESTGRHFVLAVEAENQHAARALIHDNFRILSPERNFGDVMPAIRYKDGWIFDVT